MQCFARDNATLNFIILTFVIIIIIIIIITAIARLDSVFLCLFCINNIFVLLMIVCFCSVRFSLVVTTNLC